MDNIKEHFCKICSKTSEIKIQDIQEMVKILEKTRNKFGCNNDEYIKYSHEILQILWLHMETGFVEFDDQLLCSTFFYAILLFSNEKEDYLNKVSELLNIELDIKQKSMEVTNGMFRTISLTYGIFQSSMLQQNTEQPTLAIILEKVFKILTLMAYEYSQYTFISFKIMTFFKKTIGTAFEDVIFNKENNLKLLNVINHNWENPITGVRSLNKIIFHNLISVIDETVYEIIEHNLNDFPWNKAKYLMLAEIIEQFPNDIKILLDKYDLLEGLVYSLNKAGLVSAGADMYVSIVKKLKTEEEWSIIFLPSLIKLAKGPSLKSIENFINYWCLNTLKKFPSLSKIILDEMSELDSGDHKLYIYLCIIQQSNKLGLLEKYYNNYNYIGETALKNVNHNDVHIRMVSFNIMCGLPKKWLPHQTKYELTLDFLKNNVNSDSSILRINMIKTFQNFLVQLHLTYANKSKENKDFDIHTLTSFCKQLQTFIIESLNFDGNYQRKIATIQITKYIFEIFKEIPRKKQKGTKESQTTLLEFIKSTGQWILSEKQVMMKFISLLKDPSDDIREYVVELLLSNYSEQICKIDVITYLTEEALSCMRSRFFYQISCGQAMFKLIINILLKENCTVGSFKNVEHIFDFAYGEIKSECTSNFDIVKSIVEGKQLYSYFNILYSIFEVSLNNSYELNISIQTIYSLIELLQNTSNQFAWEQELSVSSDFSKMNDMVEKLIENSEYKICHEFNETNISGLHQIVLNSLWLNVKASCDLSSILIRYYKDDNFNNVSEKCLNLICNVLETSRHKGAIEAAGAALGQAIHELSALPSESIISKLPLLLLKKKLTHLVEETSMASVTRRGAGLSIMIHRIVSNDMKKGKPLFHYFMNTILETCNKLPDYRDSEAELDKNNEKDLPQAIYIHFLTRIVTDSSLASDMMYYSGKLAKLAFDNLSSSCWQIRNAALQLYGSLIPKLIGQKKNSGLSEEVMATVAVDEFRTHFPKLWEYIGKQLIFSIQPNYDIVHCHNNLVPILSVLANLAPAYSFANEKDFEDDALLSLMYLLGSPIYVVRQLTAKCIINIYSYTVILEMLVSCKCETENSLHGTLVLLNNFNKQYSLMNMKDIAFILENKFTSIMHNRQCSYLSRHLFEYIFPECLNLTEEMVKQTQSKMTINPIASGIFLWANFRIQLYLEKAAWDAIPRIVTLISDFSDFENYCETLCKRINFEISIDENILLELSTSLYTLGFKRKSVIIWRTLYEISLHTQLGKQLDTSLLFQYILDSGVLYSMRYMIILAARIFQANATEELLSLSNIIFSLCHPDSDVDMRLTAATANNELACKFAGLSDCVKIKAISAAVVFLQDEDEDVRNLSVHFYRNVTMEEIPTHPYICWRKILCTKFLHSVFKNPIDGIQSICNDLLDLLKSLKIHTEDEYNPFANDSKNMYLESKVFQEVLNGVRNIM